MSGKKWLLAAAVGVVIALAAGVALAGEDGDAGPSFLDRVAEKLGIGPDQLEQAIRDARSDEIDEAVARGDLTQEEADRLKERLDEIPADRSFGGPGSGLHKEEHFGFGFGGGPGRHGKGLKLPPLGLFHTGDAIAEFLGIDSGQLRDELAEDGATLASVAGAHGKSRDELKAFLESEAQARLDELVAGGHIDQERADAMLERFRGHLDALIDAEMPPLARPLLREFRWPPPGHDHGHDETEPEEDGAPQEQSLRS